MTKGIFAVLWMVLPAIALLTGCRTSEQQPAGVGFAPGSELLGYFREMAPGDTLFVGYENEQTTGDTIPVTLIFAELDSLLLDQIAYGADSTSMVAIARGYWQADSLRRVCWMRVEQYWWKFEYALIFDLQRNAFTGLQPLAEFYGGEGGQIATVSWVLGNRLVTRSSEHFLEMMNEDEDPKEHTSENAALWEWRDGAYQPAAVTDTAAVVKAWPVEWGW